MTGFFNRMSRRIAEPEALPRPVPGAVAMPGADPIEEFIEIPASARASDSERPRATDPASGLTPHAPTGTRVETSKVVQEVRVEQPEAAAKVAPSRDHEDQTAGRASQRDPEPTSASRQPLREAQRVIAQEQRSEASRQAPAGKARPPMDPPAEARPPIAVQARPVQQQMTSSEATAAPAPSAPETAPPVKVSIGRIEIRTNAAPQHHAVMRDQTAAARVSLDDYLARSRR